ncbi:DUF1622 domain-containing protein [Waterburya agarophytonicola K14]|uniref:DUF1622 domain-containing protein n=1 Tax=Waterburya agarophytonicola KI4 TaxID=2874699 RepID=A0A964BQ08_9CYAN|nr:DUF1622 domain-containing protein [Waterburya agarophytonicola KI4]
MFLNYYYFLSEAALDSHAASAFDLNHFFEQLLLESALFIKIIIEGIALLIVLFAIIKAIKSMTLSFNRINGRRMNRQDTLLLVRIDLGTALSLSLEFLLAADIAATAVAPTWEKLGQLAAISAIRTFLNFFLQREIHELEHMRQSNIRTMDTQLLTE